jgi:hypothetical protein
VYYYAYKTWPLHPKGRPQIKDVSEQNVEESIWTQGSREITEEWRKIHNEGLSSKLGP